MNTLVDLIYSKKNECNRGITMFLNEVESERYTYADLLNLSKVYLGYLQSYGISKGDKVIIAINSIREFLCLFWGCISGGIIVIPINIPKNEEEIYRLMQIKKGLRKAYIISDCLISELVLGKENSIEDNEVLLINSIYLEDLKKCESKPMSVSIDKDDIAFIQYSSGSTGDPKGVLLTHENILCNLHDFAELSKLNVDDVVVTWLPLTHNMGLVGGHLIPLLISMETYMMLPKQMLMKPRFWMECLSKYQATLTIATNFGLECAIKSYASNDTNQLDLSKMHYIFTGSEPINLSCCDLFYKTFHPYGLRDHSILPVYGMTEASLIITGTTFGKELNCCHVNRDCIHIGEQIKFTDSKSIEAATFVSVGIPLKHCKVKITNSKNELLEEDYVGHIQIKGKNVTHGYLEKRLNTEVFRDGYFLTGDIGFFHDGELFITGREKDIIFSNGKNIYAFDIERVIKERMGFTDCVAVGVTNYQTYKEDMIIGLIPNSEGIDFELIKEDLRECLNTYMGIDTALIFKIPYVPKTSTGKIQRYKITEWYFGGLLDSNENKSQIQYSKNTRSSSNMSISDSKNDIQFEESILQIIKNTLEIDRVSLNDNFFRLGGNSIKLIILVNTINSELNIKIRLEQVMSAKTIKEFCEEIKKTSLEQKPCIGKLQTFTSEEIKLSLENNGERIFKASPAQTRMYIVDKLSRDRLGKNIGHNITEAIVIEGKIDYDKMKEILQYITRIHTSLRTKFDEFEGDVIQIVVEDYEPYLECYDANIENVDEIIQQFICPFDINKLPLMRTGLIKLEENKHILIVDLHHIIGDGWSLSILLKLLINRLMGEEEVSEVLQYYDYTAWLLEYLKSEQVKQMKNYWNRKFNEFGDIPEFNIPLDYNRPQVKDYKGSRIIIKQKKDFLEKVNYIASLAGATEHMVMLAVYSILLYRYSGQKKLIVGSPVAGRPLREMDNSIGMFVNMIPNIASFDEEESFLHFLEKVKENTIQALANSDYQFDDLVKDINFRRKLNRNPLFDYVFAYQNISFPSLVTEHYRVEKYNFDFKVSRFDMFLSVMRFGEDTEIILEYATSLFNRTSMETFVNQFIDVITQVYNNEVINIEDIKLQNQLYKTKVKTTIDLEGDFNFS